MVNKKISHFQILKQIDEGGMGKIFLAEDTYLHRKVALKLLPAHLTKSEVLIDRFKREAQAAAALKHPNIVTVYELFQDDDKLFIAMEYIEGVNLYDFMVRKDISINQALTITIQICRGLRKAHQAGIIHRDIKPANIMIDNEGWVKILDFGLAKLTEYKSITKLGVRMGTAPYTSPEQLRGEELKPHTDIFSLGVLLYELLARRLPFDGRTEEEIIYAILQRKPPPLSKYNAHITSSLQKTIGKALHKNPQLRYQSIDKLLWDLKRAKNFYSKFQKSTAKNSKRNVSLYVRDIESSIYRVGVDKIRTCTIYLSHLKLKIMDALGKKALITLLASMLLIVLGGASLSLHGSRNKPGDDSPTQAGPVQALMQIKDAESLLNKIETFRRLNLISVGKKVDFTSTDKCYLFVIEDNEVLDVFKIKGNSLYSLHSQRVFTSLPVELSGKTRIWVEDLTGAGLKAPLQKKKLSKASK